jgi:hypothetical protein
MSATKLRERLRLLEAELAAAEATGLIAHPRYRSELEGELAECRAAFVGAAVTEIAVLRSSLEGPLTG